MPTVKPGAKVLVTGANGYLAMWTVQKLLERGYSVRGTVRSASKGTYLTDYFKSYGERFEIAVVPDITADGAFDATLAGINAVLHVASPLPNEKIQDPEEYRRPAIEGTLSIMRSALKAPTVQRVIYTSTIGTTLTSSHLAGPTLITENDWNDEAVKAVEEKGKDAPTQQKYFASKVIAERAAWDLYKKNEDASSYHFLTIHPPWLFGPPIHDLGDDPSAIGTSIGTLYEYCLSNAADADKNRTEEILELTISWADVRDLADAHVTALEKDNVAGERIQVVEGVTSWQRWIDAFNEVQSSVSLSRPLPIGIPGLPAKYREIFDATKAYHLLDVKYRHINETARDTLELFAKKGWC